MKILLTTLHSRYIHSSLALPCLGAVSKGIEGIETVIKEFTVNEERSKVIHQITKTGADLIAFSCYIWNIKDVLEITSILKKEAGNPLIVLGGPEVSFDGEKILKENEAVDFIVKGEGEESFSSLLKALGEGLSIDNVSGIVARNHKGEIRSTPSLPLPDLDSIPSPFTAGLVNMDKPLIYYETSRGCPFTCAFCLSSIEERVRAFSMERVKSDLSCLREKRAATIKLVDRTFNYNPKRADEIWSFILEKTISSKYHFEIAADLLTDENLEILKHVPPGIFRFEIGIQSIAEETLHSVGRNSDLVKLFANIKRLVAETEIDIHLDLVAGLPGENFEGFLASLERLFNLKGHHIQVEPLKVLKGAPMMAIAKKEGYLWSHDPPYRIITTPWLDEEEIEKIETIGRLLELLYNSGRFHESLKIISRTGPLSQFFADLACYWIKQNKDFMPLDELFETLARFAGTLFNKSRLPYFCDALAFDRAMAGYPFEKGLPSYFILKDNFEWQVDRKKIAEIRTRLNISPTCMVKAVCWQFDKNIERPHIENKNPLLFIYLSQKGKKQEVVVKSLSQIFPPASSL